MLGLERVGVDESFFDLGGDSISSMQGGAGTPQPHVPPRDVFVEQTVARLPASPRATGHTDLVDEGVARWPDPDHALAGGVDGPVDQFNQTMLVQAPPGRPRPTWLRCCRPAGPPRHAAGTRDDPTRRLVVDGPEPGSLDARPACTPWTCYPMTR
ncbi:phosphopantetheine attachment site family protein [Mycobacterium xenopi 4042]|uniref:Phosphopantetheine attachment site family protein n=1 Tax=Mycobacterium xenopi 4042 TaxID=1299334 RepID=X8BJ12_MYCXE|nr:phosphopantetheine attachment site family protein [Mycobacterium xenopi 4042]